MLPDAAWGDLSAAWAYRAFAGVPLGFAIAFVTNRSWPLAVSALGGYAALTLFALFCLLDQEEALATLEFGSRYDSDGEGTPGSLYLGAGICLLLANGPLLWTLATRLVPEPTRRGGERTTGDRLRSLVHDGQWRSTEEHVAAMERRQQERSRERKAARRAQREREQSRREP